MQTFKLLVAFAVLAQTSALLAGERSGQSSASEVVVAQLKELIPDDFEEGQKFLWKFMTERPEMAKFNRYETKDWKPRFEVFAAALVAKARRLGLEADELKKAIDRALEKNAGGDNTSIAYLPVGAYRTMRNGRPVWLVVYLWEIAGPIQQSDFVPMLAEGTESPKSPKTRSGSPTISPKEKWPLIEHVRVFGTFIDTLEPAAFHTCM